MRGGGAACAPLAILAPFCTLLADEWCISKLGPILPLSRTLAALAWWFDAAKLNKGRRSGRCVLWAILSRPDAGADTGGAVSPQPLHAFKPDQAWGLRAIKCNHKILKWSQSRVWVESGGPNVALHLPPECTAQPESFPHPNPQRMCGPILHICSHLKLDLG